MKATNHVAMINLKLSLDKRYRRKDDHYSIIIRITYKGKTRDISTGFTCKETDWDSRYNSIKVTSESLKTLNSRLIEQRIKYQEKLLEFERNLLDESSDVQTIKEYVTGKISQTSSVQEFWELEIDRLNKSKRYGNAKTYKCSLQGILKVTSLKKQFNQLDYSWMMKLDTELRANGAKTNTIATYMKTLRTIYNRAINVGLVDQSFYPFRRYKIKVGKTAPRVATIDELHRYFRVCTPPTAIEYNHWNYGKLIFMLRGINFTDLALLTRDNIKHDRLVYRRSKTHKLYSIKLHPAVRNIFEYYNDPDRLALLPILTNDELLNKAIHPSRIGQLRKTTNKHLKKIGLRLGIVEPITTYLFRYSFSNVAKRLGYSKDLIGEALGHNTGSQITSLYLEQFDLELVDEMNNAVIASVTGE